MKGVLVKKILEYFLRAVVYLSIFSATAFFFSIFIDNKRVASQPPENPLTWNISPEEFERNLNEQLYNNKVHLPAIFRGNNYPNNPTEAASVNNDGNVTPVPVEQLEQPIETPTVIQNPYDFLGVRFDQTNEINIVFVTNMDQIPVTFTPVIPNGDSCDCDAGSGNSQVYADPYGNITVNPHSGFKYNLFTGNTQYEAEKLREYLEGGNYQDTIFSYSMDETQKKIEDIKNVVLYQNGTGIIMKVTAFDILPAEKLGEINYTIEPTAIASLLGKELTTKSIVLVTCGWRWDKDFTYFDDTYATAERMIMILQPQT